MLEGFGLPILAIIVILLMVYFIINKNKLRKSETKTGTVWKWTIGFGIYALIPFLFGLMVYDGSSGEGGPLYGVLLPPFWPLIPFTMFSSGIVSSLNLRSYLPLDGPDLVVLFLNIIWFVIIGFLIGKLIVKIRKRKHEK
jgi:tellurite resistance protein TehA-like permease